MTVLGMGVGGIFAAIVAFAILVGVFGGDLRPVPTAFPTAPSTPANVATRVPGPLRLAWWMVTAERTADGRVVYRVNQPEVKAAIEANVRDALRFVSYQDGLPDLSRADLYLTPERLPAVAAARATAVEQGEYWRLPTFQTLQWRGEPEFSADGLEVSWSFLVAEDQIDREILFYEHVVNGVVVLRLRMAPTVYVLHYRYDPRLERWREVQLESPGQP